MIGKLRGLVDEIGEDSIILDVNGVGYHLYCHARTLACLDIASAAEFIVESHVREDHFHLYGFMDKTEREWFRLLTSVQGVGVKMGMSILGTYTPEQLTLALASGDTVMLTRVSGVGPKLAQRLVTELKGKVGKLSTSTIIPLTPAKAKGKAQATAPTITEDAISALVNLGYARAEAFSAVANAQAKAGDVPKLDELIRHGLKELAR